MQKTFCYYSDIVIKWYVTHHPKKPNELQFNLIYSIKLLGFHLIPYKIISYIHIDKCFDHFMKKSNCSSKPIRIFALYMKNVFKHLIITIYLMSG